MCLAASDKARLRPRYRALRRSLSAAEKQERDNRVAAAVRECREYLQADILLCYVSLPIEVDTRAIMQNAWEDGKVVAVPRCVPETGEMDFYPIRSLDSLRPGAFGVPEPDTGESERLLSFSGALCVVPGLCFDRQGYRLGFGKGFYDRFLTRFDRTSGKTSIGLCYEDCIVRQLPRERHDRRVNAVVTESRHYSCKEVPR